jgi:N-methylhydantoinase A
VLRIGVDIGGTFTDFSVVDEHGKVELWKEPSRPSDPMGAIFDGLEALAGELERPLAELLSQTRLLVHGTTIATNTVIQRNGPKVGLVCTRGFRDVLFFRDAFKPERFNIRISPPEPFVERYLRVGVSERVWSDGSVITPLDEQDVLNAASHFREQGVEAIAVSLLWSIVNPAHERRVAEILREELPDCYVVCSADVLPEIREWERTSATVLSAYVLPGIDQYFGGFEERLRSEGSAGAPLIMQINGGCASIEDVLRKPVHVLHSGPAAAPAAALHHASRHGLADLISVDMGGTSFDVCLIRGGVPARSRTLQVEMQPVGVAGVDVHSIGAGGGSIAHVDSGGALKVGPRSAGSVPGPAAYGLGAEEPTVTDANVILGYLDPESFLGGRRELREDLARRAIEEHVAQPLGIDALEAAAGIVKVVNANMAAAIRAVSIERGYDPRGFALLCGGGAGGLHASALASELGITRVLIPREAGTLCAFGMTVTDVRHDYVKAAPALSSTLEPGELEQILVELENAGRARLHEDGFASEEISLERYADSRYPGQVHELTVPVPSPGRELTAADIVDLESNFHDAHEQQFHYHRSELPVELLHWRVSAVGRTPVVAQVPHAQATAGAANSASAAVGARELYVPANGRVEEVDVFKAELLTDGAVVTGPAVIAGDTTTILLDQADRMTCDADSFLMEVGAQRATAARTAPTMTANA